MKSILAIFVCLIMTGCVSVQYNGGEKFVKNVDYPETDDVVTAYVGDHLIQKGTITEECVLVVHKTIDGVAYDIPAQTYPQIGYDEKHDFFSAVGVIKGAFSDPVKALALDREPDSKLCVVTVFSAECCYSGEYERKKQISMQGSSFQQTLIYNGRVGDKIKFGYREFSYNTARPAFSNDVEYDLSTSNIVGYKGASIEVIEADNMGITYRLIKNFP